MEAIVEHQEFSITVFSHDSYRFNISQYENDPETMKYVNEELRYSDCKDFKGRKIQIAPVIRLFGTNNFGQKCAIHVHGYFPYFYVRLDDLVAVADEAFLIQFGEQLERAYNFAYASKNNAVNKVPKKDASGKIKDYSTYQGYVIHGVELVEKLDVYTYHETREKFLKVKVYDPWSVKPLCKILSNGVILDRPFQTYESHITYYMHFYSDCSIFGMSEVKVYKFKFRKNFEEMKMRAFQKIFVDREYKDSFDIYIHPFDLVQLQFSNPELFSNLPKVSTCYVELDIHYEKIVNKVQYDLREYEPLFTQTQLTRPGSGGFKQLEEFQVRITKALNALWKDEEERRVDLGIKDPMTFYIDYKNNIEATLSKKNIDFENATLDELKRYEPLMCNQMWDSSTKFKFQQHFEQYCESLKRLREEPTETPKKVFMDERKAGIFYTVLQQEKNAMVACVNTRVAEWKRRFKENQMMKKIMANDIEGDDDDFAEDEDEYKTREDIRAIEGINLMTNEKQNDSKKIKSTKNYTYPAIAFCKKCMKDVSSCVCAFTYSQSSQKLVEKLFKHPAVVQTMASENSAKSADDLEIVTEDEDEEKEEVSEVGSFSGIVTFPNYYKANKPAPSVKDVLQSLQENCNEEPHQEPYFETAKELLEHYKYKPLVFEGATNPLIFEKEGKNSEAMNYHAMQFFSRMLIQDNKPPTIRNSLKIPDCVRFYTNYEIKYREDQRKRHSQGQLYNYTKRAPSVKEILNSTNSKKKNRKSMLWRHDTKNSDFFSKISPFMKTPKTQTEKIDKKLRNKNVIADIVLFGFEVFARSRPNLLPNPDIDPISALAFLVTNEKGKFEEDYLKRRVCGLIIVDEIGYEEAKKMKTQIKQHYKIDEVTELLIVRDEYDLIQTFIALVFKFDPDIIYGYDIEKASLFYLAKRAWEKQIDIFSHLSRCPKNFEEAIEYYNFDRVEFDETSRTFLNTDSNSFDNVLTDNKKAKPKPKTTKHNVNTGWSHIRNFTLNFQVQGRVILNVWRIAEFEVKMTNYDLESVVYQVLGKRVPHYSNMTLTQMYDESREERAKVLKHLVTQLNYSLEVMTSMDSISRTVEMTRLYGIDFDSVLSRGSQFKIEAVMIRVTKANNFLLLSASKMQIAKQKMLQCVPLILEPPKQLLVDPVAVLDFQSLYPSIMIAYNYCYTTCLGHIDDLFFKGTKRIGVTDFARPELNKILGENYQDMKEEDLMKKIIITPNNVAFVRNFVREGIIPRILKEFLMTRIMIKRSMKHYENYEIIKSTLHNRQLALKLFMNVMYGYTGASFSGRMPCSDIADSVVETGKTILKDCIRYIEGKKEWNAKVLYGDTDSLFVQLKGRSLKSAFDLGQQMAREITKLHPYPVELKFEKVYLPMILFAKKRYAGYKYEQYGCAPVLESKGIETIRRDGIEATQKIMTKVFMELFENRNLSSLRNYIQKQWSKILTGHVNFKDFVFSKEVKLGKYVSVPPAGLVALNKMNADPMAAPKYRERVKYIVVAGKEGSRVKDLVVSPEQFLKSHNHKLHSRYYIENVINAALGRQFAAFNIDLSEWYYNMPKGINKQTLLVNDTHIMGSTTRSTSKNVNYNLQHFYKFQICVVCLEPTEKHIVCERCLKEPIITKQLAYQKIKYYQNDYNELEDLCRSCANVKLQCFGEVPCENMDCPIFYQKRMAKDFTEQIVPSLEDAIKQLDSGLALF